MRLDDHVLPAAAYLTDGRAHEVLATAVRAAGGRCRSVRPRHVRYRPGHDLVVRYDASVSWDDGAGPVTETLMAGTCAHGPRLGTVVLTAEVDGVELTVSVWRWPYDPDLVGLDGAVRPSSVASMLDGLVEGPLAVEVVAFRPTERAVVRVRDRRGREVYLKVVPPDESGVLVRTLERLRVLGVPAPAVLREVEGRGVVVTEALDGPTLRELLKCGSGGWPAFGEYLDLARAIGSELDLVGQARRNSRASDAVHHAAMLTTLLPTEAGRLSEMSGTFRELAARSAARPRSTIHGDLYEAQLIVRAGKIVGVLDVDDVGPGDPYDDLSTVLGHLRSRALDADARRPRIEQYAHSLRSGFARTVDRRELDLTTAAVLMGLATGPFRIQQSGWRATTRHHLDLIERLITSAGDRHIATPDSEPARP